MTTKPPTTTAPRPEPRAGRPRTPRVRKPAPAPAAVALICLRCCRVSAYRFGGETVCEFCTRYEPAR